VAVPLLIFHHILSKRVEKIIVESEGGSTALIVAITGVAHEQQAQGEDGRVENL
jgi:biopolymer transport protein ExbB